MEKDISPQLNVVSFADKRPKPTMDEGRQRLDNLFEDFVKRGCQPQKISEMILAYGICEVINYSPKPQDGFNSISRLLTDSFNLNVEHDVYFSPDLESFVEKDDDS